jgi:hypothetical protein
MRTYRSLPLAAILVAATLAASAPAGTRVAREKQLWTLENPALRVTVDAQTGALTVKDKTAGYEWRQAPAAATKAAKFLEVREVTGTPRGIAFQADFASANQQTVRLSVTLTLPDAGNDLLVTADMPDRQSKMFDTPFLEPWVLDRSDAALIVADYSDGHAYPVAEKPFPCGRWASSRLDMPWVGLCDMAAGIGYMVIVETSDDGFLSARPVKVNGREMVAPNAESELEVISI